jgi:Tol biopolymer transport system component/outer membrane protein assembly factor BamD (BamD/ComL family)
MAHCKNCGYELPETAGLLCPNCGATLLPEKKPGQRKPLRFRLPSMPRLTKREKQASPRPVKQPRPAKQQTPRPVKQERSGLHLRITSTLWKRLIIILLALVVFSGVMAAAAYLGLYFGERDRQTARQNVVQEHYTAGLQALNEGRFERAVAEFQYVLQLDPQHALAEQGLTEARARLAIKPTPTLEAVISLAEQLLDQAHTSFEADEWVATARTLTQLRALDPDYERDAVEEMLFTSLYNAGIAFLDEEALEVGISYLDQAIALRPLDADAVNQRNLAARYLDALNYWGVDWELCIDRFETLYATNPGYKDVAQRVYRAYLAYADYFAAQGEMCPAEMQYTQALRMYADPTIDQKRADAAQICIIATPTPLEGTTPHLTPQPIPGFTYGRLAYPVYNSTTDVYDLYALYADGRILRAATGADQPWWELGTGRLAYRDKVSGGVKMVLPEEGIPLQLLAPLGQAWPTLSPDSRRVAYAAVVDGVWSIYIANTDGSGEPRRLGAGWAPAWGASGLLAYTGCDADGKCGITLDNPDDDQPGTLLTGSQDDSAVSWAPAGNMMAYMTNVTGNWDIILLNPQGGVQQLTFDASDEGLPVWSPDGGHIAFVSNRDGNWAIYVMQLDGQNVQRLLDLGSSLPGWENQRLSWVP